MPILAPYEICTGCSACVNACHSNALSMFADGEGFLFPKIDMEACTNCNFCEKACPIVTPIEPKNLSKPFAYAVWSEADRTLSSSGGAFSAFARDVIAEGGVVFGAVCDANMSVHHIEIDSINDLPVMRGSKYLQSAVELTFQKVRAYLEEERVVLYTGTPCQIAGLKAFLKGNDSSLLTLDLACHGVPSSTIFRSYLNKLKEKRSDFAAMSGFAFRRLDGWGFSPSAIINGKLKQVFGTDNLYMNAFEKNMIFRESCYTCPFAKIPREGDCTIADFWGIGRHGKPFQHDVLRGVSLVLANNSNGLKAIQKINKHSFVEERPLKEALVENINLTRPSQRPSQRNEIVAAFVNNNFSLDDIEKRYSIVDRSFKKIMTEYASKYHVFVFVKRIYNKYKTL